MVNCAIRVDEYDPEVPHGEFGKVQVLLLLSAIAYEGGMDCDSYASGETIFLEVVDA